MPRTYAQRFAAIANECIQAVPVRDFEGYKARADSFPTFVMQAGLAQAVGFLKAKGSKEPVYALYLKDLAKVLGKRDATHLYQEVIAAELNEYRLLTRQALAAAGWLKRMAQARKVQ
ncbi:MAG: type III-B CRISPR module-associated protein Cmr5 [Thermodesulfobacteriota bacterium]